MNAPSPLETASCPSRHIARAAIQTMDGEIVSLPRPGRHCDILRAMGAGGWIGSTQGFVTNTGEFVGRVEALAIARTARQIIQPLATTQLYSGDVW